MRTRHAFPPAALAALLALAPAGCGPRATAPVFEPRIALSGHLYVGEAVTPANALLLTRTRPVEQPYDPAAAALTGAVVLLRADGAAAPDTLHMVAPGRYANPAVTIAANTTYHLVVQAGSETVTASTTTPSAFTATGGPDELPGVVRYASLADSFPIVVQGPGPDEIVYVDAYCLEPWQDARYVYPFGDDPHPKDFEEYGGENSEPRHLWAYFRLGDLGTVPGGWRLGMYADLLAFYGEYRVGVFTIDRNYYEYLHRDRPELHGGVVGGIGVFGSACRRQYRIRAIE